MFVIVFRNDRCNTCAVRGLFLSWELGIAVPLLPVVKVPRTFCFRFCAFFCRNKKQQISSFGPEWQNVKAFASVAADSAIGLWHTDAMPCRLYISVYAGADISSAYSSKRLLHAPASGFRTWATGDLTVVGVNGYCWCSSAYAAGNANGGGISFSASDITLLSNYQRARAVPVRCVQHLQAAFFRESSPRKLYFFG